MISFVEHSPFVDSIRNAFDSLTNKPADPFFKLTDGLFTPDSLYKAPKSGQRYEVQVDTTRSIDTIFTPSGKIKRIENEFKIGTNIFS